MFEPLYLYARYAGISLRAQMQYRASFLLQVFAQLSVTFLEFLFIAALLARFGSLQGWSLAEVAVLYGLVHTAFALAESVARGFDVFPGQIKNGGFDRVLLRPRSLAFQVLASELQLMRVGRLAQGLGVLAYGIVRIDGGCSAGQALLMAWAILGGACLFSGLFVFMATASFWTIESLEVMNIFIYGGVEAAQFPVEIYQPWLRRILTFVLPLACINYVPAHALLPRLAAGDMPAWLPWLAPLAGVAFLLLSLGCWRLGVRHYTTTGS